jgi:hypothetical protein
MTFHGGCFCGKIRYEVEGSPNRVTNCHCTHCRRISAAPYMTWAEFELSKFTLTKGRPGHYESRPGATRQFCQSCGSQITFAMTKPDGYIYLPVGGMDEPEGIIPQDDTWARSALPWVHLDDSLPRYEKSGFPAN